MIFIFLQFDLTSLRGKEYVAKLKYSQEPEPEPGAFGSVEPEPLEKKYQEPELEPLVKKNQEPKPEQLDKKSGAGAAKKFAGSPALLYSVF